jgi:hypothetical protein
MGKGLAWKMETKLGSSMDLRMGMETGRIFRRGRVGPGGAKRRTLLRLGWAERR